MERKRVKKIFWVWQFEEEERWLNAMALEGWVLDRVGFFGYEFLRCEPGEYTIRLEMHDHDEAYLSFMEETGAEYVGRIVKWVYFRKKTELGAFDIFSDLDSRLNHLKRIGTMLKGVGLAVLVIGLVPPRNPACLIAGAVLMYALGRIEGKKEALEKDRLLME